eukprot:c18424_g1_i1 orf=89-994(+)
MAMAALTAHQACLPHASSASPTLLGPPLSFYQFSCRQSFPCLSVSRNSHFGPRVPSRSVIITAEASSGRGTLLDGLAAQVAERTADVARFVSQKTSEVLQAAGSRVLEFEQSLDLRGKLVEVMNRANWKLEELSYDVRKGAEKWERRYRISRRAQQALEFTAEKLRNVDQQFGIGQKARIASLDFRRNFPTYQRRLDRFLQTPLGKAFSTLVFLWLVLSGWLFRIIFFSMWILPLAAPLFLNTVTRNAIVEGACPSCKRRFIGNRSQIIVCNYCRAVVWQPQKQHFSKGNSDPQIIDIDID